MAPVIEKGGLKILSPAGGACLLAALVAAQTAALLRTPAGRSSVAGLAQAPIVAAVYLVARALSLVLRTHHDARRKG